MAVQNETPHISHSYLTAHTRLLRGVKWVTYRQQLRDLPEGYTSVANPVYPTRP